MENNGRSELIDIDEIKIDNMQSRLGHWTDDAKDDALVDSMRGIGQVQDVIVRELFDKEENFKYGLVAGSRRYHALIKAGKSKVRAIVKDLNDVEALELSISENIGRKDLTLFEETVSTKKLHELLMEKEEMSSWESQQHIAKIFYGNKERAKDISSILSRMNNIPEMALALLKKPEERTQEEKVLLKKYSIPLDYKGTSKTVTDALASLSLKLNGISDEEKTDKLFTAFKELHLYLNIGDEELRKRIITLRNNLEEGNPFEIALQKTKEREMQFLIERAYSIPSFYLPSQKYWDWHGKAVLHSRMEPTDLIQKVYVDWLDKEAKKEGW